MISLQERFIRILGGPTQLSLTTTALLVSGGFALAQTPKSPDVSTAAAPVQASPAKKVQDWAGLGRYREENAQLPAPAAGEERVIFMGDSITDAWKGESRPFFTGKPYVNRGISGQTTPQMLIRFRPDVIERKPKVVVILAGTNDLAGNTGPMTPGETLGNLRSMAELAQASGIRVVLASVLPAIKFQWRPEMPNPADRIIALNLMIKDYAVQHDFTYLDYHSAMVDSENGLKYEYAEDSVHPNQAGYDAMAPLAEQAIAQALSRR